MFASQRWYLKVLICLYRVAFKKSALLHRGSGEQSRGLLIGAERISL